MKLDRRQAFGVAAVIACIASVLLYYLISSSSLSRIATQAEQSQTVDVVTATVNISPSAKITPAMVDLKSVTVATAPTNAIGSTDLVIGQIARSSISKGQLLVRNDVAAPDATQGLTFVIPKGKRAVTVALDPISGVGGFVYAQDHVDILVTLDQEGTSATHTILQNIEVLAMNDQTVRPIPSRGEQTDADAEPDKESPVVDQVKSATLSVTPEEAQRLILAAARGSIHMVLRSREDTEEVPLLEGATDWELAGLEAPKPEEPEAAPPPPATIQSMSWPPGYVAPPPAPSPTQPTAVAAPTIEVIRGREHSIVTTSR